MIVSMYLGLLEVFFDALPVIEFPSLDLLMAYTSLGMQYFIEGISFLTVLIGNPSMQILKLYLTVVIVLNSFYLAYQILWWFIKKIPLLDISQ